MTMCITVPGVYIKRNKNGRTKKKAAAGPTPRTKKKKAPEKAPCDQAEAIQEASASGKPICEH